jgi:uncharacterized OB-fold protein
MMAGIKAILPAPKGDSAEFWAACNRGRLLLRSCDDCRHVFYYPRIHCPRCGSRRLGWVESRGEGTVFSFTDVQISFYGPAWESELPYTVLLVDLDEGPRMLSRLVGGGPAPIGARVRVDFVTVEGQALPFFRLAGGAEQ